MTMPAAPTTLILAEAHTLEPFTVQGQQFLCRAAAFSTCWPGPVELWLPGPALPSEAWRRRAGFAAERLTVRFGPPLRFKALGRDWRAGFVYRAWIRLRLTQLASDKGKALLYFRTLSLADAMLPTLRRQGWRYVFEPHEVFFENARRPERLRKVEVRVYQQAAHLFPITRALDDAIRQKLAPGTPSTPAPLGHNGANFALPDYDPAAPPRFLFIGSLLPWKGLELAFAATAGLNVPFDVVGDAGGLDRYRAYCAERGFNHVVFHGHVAPDQLAGHYHPGTICLLPLSDSEIARSYTSPLKLFEYLAAGRPVVAGDLPSLRELVSDGVEARLAAVGDEAAWRAALTQLLADRQGAARLAAQARARAQSCTWQARAEALAPILNALA